MRTVLVTDATQYTWPGAVSTLVRLGWRVIAHDISFGARLDPDRSGGGAAVN